MKTMHRLKLVFIASLIYFVYQPAKTQLFEEQSGITLSGISDGSATWGDYDNDGDLDILLTGNTGTSRIATIYRNNGDRTFTGRPGIELAGVSNSAVAWGDYDNDGDLDILLTGRTSATTRTSKIYKNNGDSTFTEQTGISLTAISEGAVSFGDYDNDGFLDILLTGYTGGTRISKIYKNNGDNSFTEQTGISLTGVHNCSSAWVDYDNDGDLDVFLSGFSSSGYISRIYKNNGDNTFTYQTGISLTGVNYSSSDWDDYDNDGDMDLLLSGQVNSTTRITKIYKNNADNTFSEQSEISLTGVEKGCSAWGDYDNDGDPDILLTGYTGTEYISKIYENINDSTFAEAGIVLTGISQGSAIWGDYDKDDDLDILLTGYTGSGRTSKIYKNLAASANTAPTAPVNLQYTINGYDVTFNWDKSTDIQTPGGALSYNLYVSALSNRETNNPVMSDLTSGFRKIVRPGNTSLNNSHTLKNLIGGRTYYFGVQAIDHCFKGGAFSTEQSFFKPAIRPAVQTSEIVKTAFTDTSITISWTNGNGSGRVVFVRQDETGTAAPSDSISYIAGENFGSGSQIGSGGWFCVYNGNGSQVTVNSLLPAKKYRIMVCEYDGLDGTELYNTGISSGNPITVNTVYFEEQTGITLEGTSLGTARWGDYDNDGDLDILLVGATPPLYRNNGDNTFTEQPGISMGILSWTSACWGDYDNDGYLDILVSGYISTDNHATKIYRNMGNGTFTEQTGISLPDVAFGAVDWGDYDDDGDLDILLSGEENSNDIITRVYKNNGNNTFSEQTGIQLTGLTDGDAAWGDYDNDGDLDILSTGWDNWDPYSKIYRNNGDNTFTEQNEITLANVYYGSVAWGDYNNDGYPDILLTGQINTTYSCVSKVYKNNGDNSFTEQAGISLTGVYSGSAAWGDYDNDGDLDILVTGRNGSAYISKIYNNINDSTFTEETGISLTGISNSSVAWGDYDNDGDLDILMTGYTGSTSVSKIYKNLSAVPNLKPSTPANLKASANDCQIKFTWDKSNDNETPRDALTYNLYVSDQSYEETVNPAMSDLTGGFRKIVKAGNVSAKNNHTLKNLLGDKTYYWSVQAIDNNYSGSAFYAEQSFFKPLTRPSEQASKIVQTASSDTSVSLRWINGNGYRRVVFMSETDSILPDPADGSTYTAGDRFMSGSRIGSSGWYCVQNSDACELTVTGLQAATEYYFMVLEYDGAEGSETYNTNTAADNPASLETGYFEEQTGIVLTGVGSGSVAWGDYDNDNDLDILLTGNNTSGKIAKIYRNNGDNSFTEQTGIALQGVYYSAAAWGDFNNDNYLDILLTGYTGSERIAKIYSNNGDSTFSELTGILPEGVYRGSADWEDYDNDGDLDILITGLGSSGGMSRIYKNNGDSTFTGQTEIVLTGVYYSSTAWGDYNNDGYSDILLTGRSAEGRVSEIYKNNGDNTFTLQTGIILQGVESGSVAWEDYNNDGDLDILLCGDTGPLKISKIYRNNGDNTFTEQTNICLTGTSSGTAAWCDYDNDGYPDILLTGYINETKRCAKIYRNNSDNRFTEQTGLPFTKVSSASAAFGDYDNDGHTDILITGYSNQFVSSASSKIFRNISSKANTRPGAPANLQINKNGNTVTLIWDRADDNETPQNGLSYNVYVSLQGDTGNIKNSMSIITGGFRKLVHRGNAGRRNSYTIGNLSEERDYSWSVQAVDASFAGGMFAAEQSFSLTKAGQVITFDTLSVKTYGDDPFELTATAGPGLPVSYTSSDTSVAIISITTVTVKGAGITTITASQAGNCDYNPAPDVTRILQVNKAGQSITFGALPDKTIGDDSFELTATAGSGLPVSYFSSDTSVAKISGNTVIITGPGTAIIKASQAGNENYNSAPDAEQTLTVIPLSYIPDSEIHHFRIYPNPAGNTIFIDAGETRGKYEIISLTGEVVLSGRTSGTTLQLNLEQLETGIYLLKFVSDRQVMVSGFIRE